MLFNGFDNISSTNSYFFSIINIAVPLIPGIMVDSISINPSNIYVNILFSRFIFIDNLFINNVVNNMVINSVIFCVFLFLNSSKVNSVDPIIKPIKSNSIKK